MDAPLALYRRYRPETFAEVIGQDHVTVPLRHALANNRVNHAYLFSGPRGCGKTTSARILARALNCEKAPDRRAVRRVPVVPRPRPRRPGQHRRHRDRRRQPRWRRRRPRPARAGVLRAGQQSRYKVYIIDEAHMVSPAGLQRAAQAGRGAAAAPALHLRDDRARQGHRHDPVAHPPLPVPAGAAARLLGDYLAELCARGGRDDRADRAAARRAGRRRVGPRHAVRARPADRRRRTRRRHLRRSRPSLLGYTPDSLLDEVVDAFAADDGSAVFGVVDKVIETGQDPRRFAEDLLHRLRDLVIVAAVPDAAGQGLIDVPGDQAERLSAQAGRFGPAELTRAADIVSAALTEMRGATAPRLLLELMCARILLPGADDSNQGINARLDRLERRILIAAPASAESDAPMVSEPEVPAATRPDAGAALAEQRPASQAESAAVPVPTASPARPSTGLGLLDVRRLWPDVLAKVKEVRRFTWVMLSQNSQVIAVDDATLTLGLVNAGARDSFTRSGSDEIVRQAIIDVLGVDWRVEAILDPTATGAAPEGPQQGKVTQRAARPVPEPPEEGEPRPARAPSTPPAEPAPTPVRPDPESRAAARDAIKSARTAAQAQQRPASGPSDADASPDDPIDESVLGQDELLARELGAQVIEEIPHDGQR